MVFELERNVGFGAAVNTGGGRRARGDDDRACERRRRAGAGRALASLLLEPLLGYLVRGDGRRTHERIPTGSGLVDGFGIELDVTLAAYNRLRCRRPVGEE